jgi:hypothetical protein
VPNKPISRLQFMEMAKKFLYIFPKFASGFRTPRHSKFIANIIQKAIEEQDDITKRHNKHKIFIAMVFLGLSVNIPRKR